MKVVRQRRLRGIRLANQKSEQVSVSFHYLVRTTKQSDGSISTFPFQQGIMPGLAAAMSAMPQPNLADQQIADRIRYRHQVPLFSIELIDDRTIFGSFKASYWGHAYENTAKGEIPADSISLRPFYFLLYLSVSGRIYVASQYLGQFGGYGGLQNTLAELLGARENIVSHSFRLGSHAYRDAEPKEVHVQFSSRASSIAEVNRFGKTGILVFKKSGKNDEFEQTVKRRLFPLLDRSKAEMKQAVANLISESDLIDAADSAIEDCTVIAKMNGKRRTIYLIDEGSFATKFPIDVPVKADGHPVLEPTRDAMLKLLRDEIIARKENV